MKIFLRAFFFVALMVQITIMAGRLAGYIETSPTWWVIGWLCTVFNLACFIFIWAITKEPKNEHIKFCWFPVELYVYKSKQCRHGTGQWQPTGKKAWLRRVRMVKTVWGETFYTDKM